MKYGHDRRVRKKLLRLRERIRKVCYFRVSEEMFKIAPDMMGQLTQDQVKRLGDRRHVKSVLIQTGISGSDWMQNYRTIRIDYTYPKYLHVK